MRASGPCGEVRYGYQVAIRTGPWTIARFEDGPGSCFMFAATVTDVDEVWLAQRPLDLVLALGQVEWVWRAVAPSVVDGRVELRLTRRPDVIGPRAA